MLDCASLLLLLKNVRDVHSRVCAVLSRRLRDGEAREAARPPLITDFQFSVRGIAIAVMLAIPLWVGTGWLMHRLLR
jgi:hypothetical protein